MSRLPLLALLALASAPRPAASVAVGDAVLLLDCGADAARQAFTLVGASGGDLRNHIVSDGSAGPALVFDITGPSNASGTPLHMWGSYSPPVANQQWSAAAADGAIVSLYNNMCLGASDVDPASGAPTFGATVGIYACNASDPAQRFTVAPGGSHTIVAAAAPGLCMQAANATPTCDDAPFRGLPYCNASLPVEARVADLVARMSPAEKAAALDSGVPAIARLGVPSMHSGEALHGALTGCLGAPAPGSTGCPTSFPCPTALGAAFDEALWTQVGLAIGTETRALYNLNAGGAAWIFAPNINPARDPRWGRVQEVAGEDAALVAAYGAAVVRGVQGEGGADPAHLLAAATLKHWVAYDMEGYIPRTDPQPRPASATCDTPGGCQRWNFDALVNARDLNGYYAAPFVAAVSAGARSIMCAYSAVQGAAACGSPLLNSMLRDALAWDGHVVSDCTAIELMGDAKYDNCKVRLGETRERDLDCVHPGGLDRAKRPPPASPPPAPRPPAPPVPPAALPADELQAGLLPGPQLHARPRRDGERRAGRGDRRELRVLLPHVAGRPRRQRLRAERGGRPLRHARLPHRRAARPP